jgi:hypothetical protein
MGLAIRNLDRMDKNKLEDHLAIAEKFLQGLHMIDENRNASAL